MLNNKVNYIVSGLERSGTSVMMQMMNLGGLPVSFDDSRQADEHNPKGYFELAGGKIINQLMDKRFDFDPHKGHVVKITAYGLKFLPEGNYKIIYMMRDMDEILKSMQKMGADIDADKDRILFNKLNKFCFDMMDSNKNIEYITVNYHDVINTPEETAKKVNLLLEESLDVQNAIKAVDSKLYRNRA